MNHNKLSGKNLSTQAILDDYKENGSRCGNDVLKFYSSLPDLKTAIAEAGKFHKDSEGHCHEHQWRIQVSAKEQFAKDLPLAKKKIEDCEDFESLYECCSQKCGKSGVGDLTIYDTAMRLGAYLEKAKGKKNQFKPKEVHLHTGTFDGAKTLYQKGILEEKPRRNKLMPVSHFSKIFPKTPAWRIEEILCIYKENF